MNVPRPYVYVFEHRNTTEEFFICLISRSSLAMAVWAGDLSIKATSQLDRMAKSMFGPLDHWRKLLATLGHVLGHHSGFDG